MTDKTENKRKEYFDQYWRYGSAMRNWLVAFGIGLCALIMSDRASNMGWDEKRLVIDLAGLGLIIQFVLALRKKILYWYMYRGTENELFRETRRYCWSKKMSGKFWIDIIADVATVVFYCCSVIIMRNSIDGFIQR